jgi:hypothetical protein
MEREDREEQEVEARRLSLRSSRSRSLIAVVGPTFPALAGCPYERPGLMTVFDAAVISPDPTECPCLDGTSTIAFHTGLWVSGYCCLTSLSSFSLLQKRTCMRVLAFDTRVCKS